MIYNMRSSESIVVRVVLRVLYGMCVIVRVYGRTHVCVFKKKRELFFFRLMTRLRRENRRMRSR